MKKKGTLNLSEKVDYSIELFSDIKAIVFNQRDKSEGTLFIFFYKKILSFSCNGLSRFSNINFFFLICEKLVWCDSNKRTIQIKILIFGLKQMVIIIKMD